MLLSLKLHREESQSIFRIVSSFKTRECWEWKIISYIEFTLIQNVHIFAIHKIYSLAKGEECCV